MSYVPVVAALLIFAPLSVHAELIVGLTTQSSLIAFDSATPGVVATIGAITGITAGDTLVGIDRRPQIGPNNGVLYALGVNAGSGTGRIYRLNETTAEAALVSTLSFAGLAGRAYGVDFNPVPDRFRVVNDAGRNLRVNVDTGATIVDGSLAYDPADPNAGTTPVVVAAAYANNFGGATSTTLRDVDIGKSPDLLVIQNPPNSGTLSTAFPLGFESTSLLGYDISGLTGTPYFSVGTAAAGSSLLFAGTTLVGTIGGGVQLADIAAPVGAPIPEPSTLLLSSAALLAIAVTRRRKAQAR